MINPLKPRRMLALTFALTATLVAFAQEGGKGDPDRAVTGGQFPAGWSARPDRGANTGIKFSQTGDVYHFQMGTTGTMWRSDWTKSGNYTYSARLTQMKKASHPVSYGLVIGGSNMGPRRPIPISWFASRASISSPTGKGQRRRRWWTGLQMPPSLKKVRTGNRPTRCASRFKAIT